MNRLAIATTAFAALTTTTFAADMPLKAPPPVPAASSWSWAGFYIGLNAGGAWGKSNVNYAPPGPPFTGAVAAYSAIGSGSLDPRSFTGGVQAGYNVQTGPLVFGLEGDFGAMDLRSSFTQTGTPPANVSMTATASVQTNWLATARARVGFTPVDRLLVYVTGGGAWTNLKYNEANAYGGLGTVAFSSNSTDVAGIFGGGFEYGIMPHWSVKAEYLYANFGTFSGTSLFPGFTGLHSYSANLKLNVARAGINYHF